MSIRRPSPLLLALFVVIPSVAAAAPLDGRVRLGLETSVLSYEGFTLKAGGAELSRSETGFGLGGGGLGVDVGVGLGEHFILGGRALYQSSTGSGDGPGGSVTTTGVAISVTPEYVLSGDSGDAVRPFVGVTLGHRGVATDTGGVSTSTSLTFVGPAVGVHWFAAESLSIDPGLTARYETGGMSSAGVDVDRSGFVVLLGIGLSGWLGGTPAHVESQPSTASARPAVASVASGLGVARDGAPEAPAPPARVVSPESVAPRPTPTAELHDLKVRVSLGGASRLLLTANAHRRPSVDVVLITDDSPELRACTELAVEGLAEPLALGPFTTDPVGAGSASLLALRTTAPLLAVQSIGKARDLVTLHGCGQSIELNGAARDVLARLAALARRAIDERRAESR